MLLVIDVGNSNSEFGVFDGDTLCLQRRLTTDGARTADELRTWLTMFLQQAGIEPVAISGAAISSVVPQCNRALDSVCRDGFGVAPIVVGPGIKTGVKLRNENPKQVGADRIVNIVAALEEYGGPFIVVDFGTATTFDYVSEDAERFGGIIVPGIQLAADALFQRCALLPRVEIARPQSVIGRDTVSSIQSGLTYGYADLVDGLIGRLAEETESSPKVIATGGLAGIIAGVASRIDAVDPILSLKGLKWIHAKNAAFV